MCSSRSRRPIQKLLDTVYKHNSINVETFGYTLVHDIRAKFNENLVAGSKGGGPYTRHHKSLSLYTIRKVTKNGLK
jgi:hypothetical protein